MTDRAALPQRRVSLNLSFRHGDPSPHAYIATVGYRPDGKLGEVFLNTVKASTELDTLARDGAIALSLAIQHGCPDDTLRKALTRRTDGTASGPLGKLLDLADEQIEIEASV